jgi:hypothetical protein
MKPIKPKKNDQNRLLQHILFWSFSYYILLRFFSNSEKIQKIDYIYTALFHISIVVGVYLNLLILIPKLLNRRKFFFYFISLALVIAGTAEFNILFFDNWVDYVLPGYYFISYYEFNDILKFVTVYIVSTSLIKLAKSWFELSKTNQRLLELQKEKTEAELKALKSQINPHFLFNSLNVLYSLVLKKSEESPDAIIKLSDILRYVIYETKKEYVSLSEEIKLINDYLDLQKFRIDNDSTVDFKYVIENNNLKIAPMLLLPLVENSFKHGIKGDIDKTFVTIFLRGNSEETIFEIKNNKGKAEQIDMGKNDGIGLNNIADRLKLIYPNYHTFEINESTDLFEVKLTIRNED